MFKEGFCQEALPSTKYWPSLHTHAALHSGLLQLLINLTMHL